MKVEWTQKDSKTDWHFGKTTSRFRAEVGPNTDREFSWLIFHEDFRHVVFGESAETVEKAKSMAEQWLENMTKIKDIN
jgi:hypothetical protein